MPGLGPDSPETHPTYRLSGQLEGGAHQKVYLYERAIYKAKNRVDSTQADAQGNFRFGGHVSEPTYYMPQTSLNTQALYFYLENIPMHINGQADSLYQTRVTGSPQEAIRQQHDQVS
ncbi:DUF4369 domain-containing protein [Spirosoma validum]|uniref:DUF4369 domain-containing protein n=1 Tax=Spirosoma validum TaxID=2771355 RepID=A0A927B9L0_9BACT|nr:DUF4369 domain-containing protein [Spirosoma validum]MBD2757889.1 DUF4369 domain-containing protein [Spirosoma validum]